MSGTESTEAVLAGTRADRKRRKSKPLWMGLLLASIIVFSVFLWLGAALHNLYGRTYVPLDDDPDDPVASIVPHPKPGERINILVLGLDVMDGDRSVWARSDTMMVVSVDPMLETIGVLSIPRDTNVEIAGRERPDKIGHAHAYGGVALAVRTVTDFLGVPVHYYVRVDYRGFVSLVDVLGGVEITVDSHMFYQDPCQNLYIDIRPGTHKMDGQLALEYVRYRGDLDRDIGRIGRQQLFLTEFMQQALRIGTVFKLPQILTQLEENVSHNLPRSLVAELLFLAPKVGPDRVTMGVVPGDHGWVNERSVWLADEGGTRLIVDELLIGVDREANSRLTVELVDGTGINGRAAVVAQQLQSWGYLVHLAEPPGEVTARTQVIMGLGEDTPGKVLARALDLLLDNETGVELYRAVGEPGETDLTIILGSDFGG